ncbi:hypothetical protein [Litoribrevibacter albus]|uniref:Uncharacterized protein n=1 Tax=Litoribrevibacter albus TaxID=1473156 RepID=A0AA37S8X6_9GAMM|nr:hypothetical protein [Litoribrevibacter albus]GLQ30579.1 hypothetical protein GCM10007876_10570 [Litoribrevibacter albus]
MKLTIKGSVGDSKVDLEVELQDSDVRQALALLKDAKITTDAPVTTDTPVSEAPLVRSRPEAKSSELALSLQYIENKGEVTQYQLIDHLADEGHRDANIKRAIMWLKHHADVKVDTVSRGEHSQYYVFRWLPHNG